MVLGFPKPNLPRTGMEYPLLRAFGQCPLCGQGKPSGALCCWLCFNEHAVDGGPQTEPNVWAEARFKRAEANLKSVQQFDEWCDRNGVPGQFEIAARLREARR